MASTDSFEVQQLKNQILELQFQIQQLRLEKEELRIKLLHCGEVAGSSEKTGGAPGMKKPTSMHEGHEEKGNWPSQDEGHEEKTMKPIGVPVLSGRSKEGAVFYRDYVFPPIVNTTCAVTHFFE